MFDHPPDESVPGIRSKYIGDTVFGNAAARSIGAVDKLLDIIDDLVPW